MTEIKKRRLPPSVLRTSYPSVSSHPIEVRVGCTLAELRSALEGQRARVFDFVLWKRNKTDISKALREHAWYDVVVQGLGGVRRSAEAGVRRIEDVMRWRNALAAERGEAFAKSRLDELIEYGRARRAMRRPGVR